MNASGVFSALGGYHECRTLMTPHSLNALNSPSVLHNPPLHCTHVKQVGSSNEMTTSR